MILDRIILNTSNLQKGGALQVSRSFIDECTKYPEIMFHIILGKETGKMIIEEDFEKYSNLKFYKVDIHPTDSICSYFKFKIIMNRIEKKIIPTGVLTVFGPCYWKPASKHVMGFANGLLLYDDSPYVKSSLLNRNLKFLIKKYLHKFLLRTEADWFWTETYDAKLRLAKFIGISNSRIIVASNTYSSYFEDNNNFDVDQISSNRKLKILYVSSYYKHKNFGFIPLVYNELISQGYNCEFQVTLKPEDFENNDGLKNCEGVVNLGPIRPSDCPRYYSACDIVFVPSLLEIFTAVYPEAMISKKPIITSNLDFAVSVCGDAALYYDHTSPKDAATKIINVIENQKLGLTLVENGLKRLNTFDNSESRFYKILQTLK